MYAVHANGQQLATFVSAERAEQVAADLRRCGVAATVVTIR